MLALVPFFSNLTRPATIKKPLEHLPPGLLLLFSHTVSPDTVVRRRRHLVTRGERMPIKDVSFRLCRLEESRDLWHFYGRIGRMSWGRNTCLHGVDRVNTVSRYSFVDLWLGEKGKRNWCRFFRRRSLVCRCIISRWLSEIGYNCFFFELWVLQRLSTDRSQFVG